MALILCSTLDLPAKSSLLALRCMLGFLGNGIAAHIHVGVELLAETDEGVLGPDYMSRAGPVSRVGVSLPGSRHIC